MVFCFRFFTFLLIICTGVTSLFSQVTVPPYRPDIEEAGKRVIDNILSRSEHMMYSAPGCTALHYAESAAGVAALRFARLVNDSVRLNLLIDRYVLTTREFVPNTANHVGANVYGIVPMELYIKTRNIKFLKEGLYYADEQWQDTLPNGLTSQARLWIDDAWMIGILQVQAYRITHDNVYLERAAKTVAVYIQQLQRPNGLCYHGHNAPFFWARGNGWMAAIMAEILNDLPTSNPYYSTIIKSYKKMMSELLRWQDEEGMWHQLIDKKHSFQETSSTAMFAYAMAVGINKGILSRSKYQQSVEKVWNALLLRLDDSGQLSDVCVDTDQSSDVNYYLNRPRTNNTLYGHAPLLWLAYQMMLL